MALISDADISFLHTLYPELQQKRPTPQQEQALVYYMRGMTVAEAARAAGMPSGARFKSFLELDSTKALMEHLRDKHFADVRITRESVTAMFMEAYHKAATSAEMVGAARELAKLHGLYPENKPNVNVNINAAAGSNVEINAKKVERMSDAELLQMAPDLMSLIAPPVPLAQQPVDEEAYVVSEQ